jgi:hypothetical protein
MGKPRKEHPQENSIFANNPFIEGLFEWMDSPEGEKHREIYDALSKLLEDVHLDARERQDVKKAEENSSLLSYFVDAGLIG